MKPRVYIETSIPSFYYQTRPEPEMLARQQWRRTWWDECRKEYFLITSAAVIDELQRGDYPSKNDALELINTLPLVAVEDAVADIVQAYIRHNVMPHDPVGDALHLALASYHRCDFLMTWNCRHLANAKQVRSYQASEHSAWSICTATRNAA